MQSGYFSCGDVRLASGQTLHDTRLAWRMWGTLSDRADNCILVPAYYGGSIGSYAPLIGPGNVFDTDRYCVITPGLLGAGESTSPSTYGGGVFPLVDMRDNVRCQRRMLREQFGVENLPLVAGWSLGGMQALYWAAMYPQAVSRVLATCATANCWPQNKVFLEGMESILTADAGYAKGGFAAPPVASVKAFARSYCGWAYSPDFFRTHGYRELGYHTLESFLNYWEEDHLEQNAADLLAVLRTWKSSSFRHGPGDDVLDLADITARVLLLPSVNDAYFIESEVRMETAWIAQADVWPLVTRYGHCAGAPGRFDEATGPLARAVASLLAGESSETGTVKG